MHNTAPGDRFHRLQRIKELYFAGKSLVGIILKTFFHIIFMKEMSIFSVFVYHSSEKYIYT